MAAELQELSNMIASSVSTLLQACNDNGTPFPQPNDPFTPQSEAFRNNKIAANATNIIAAAALQLAARVLPPQIALMNIISGHFKNAALRSAIELNVTEILREAGPKGLPISIIAQKCDVDANKLGRLLRILAIEQCYKEVTPDVFANTRMSSVMDTGKSAIELFAKPEDKHEGTTGLVALLEHFTGDGAKFSSQLLENLRDPATGRSSEPVSAPFNRVFNVSLPLWLWYESEEQSYRRRRFAVAMKSLGQMQPHLLSDVLDWQALAVDSIIVDVGGGIGTSSVTLAQNNRHLNFIVQDLPNVCAEALNHWKKACPGIVESGRLTFAPHDFFTSQPIRNASVFILKQILHDWTDPYCTKILKALREAARADTRLVVIDNIVAHACHDPSIEWGSGFSYEEAPAPILPNYGAANVMPYMIDIGMMLWLNAQERTLKELDELLRSTGWKLVDAKRHDPPNNFYEPVIAGPI